MSTIIVDNIRGTAEAVATGFEVMPKVTWSYHQVSVVLQASVNVSSVTDTASGRALVNFSNVFSDTLYQVLVTAAGYTTSDQGSRAINIEGDSTVGWGNVNNKATSSIPVMHGWSTTLTDTLHWGACLGTLA